jgi:hypothetical protein
MDSKVVRVERRVATVQRAAAVSHRMVDTAQQLRPVAQLVVMRILALQAMTVRQAERGKQAEWLAMRPTKGKGRKHLTVAVLAVCPVLLPMTVARALSLVGVRHRIQRTQRIRRPMPAKPQRM